MVKRVENQIPSPVKGQCFGRAVFTGDKLPGRFIMKCACGNLFSCHKEVLKRVKDLRCGHHCEAKPLKYKIGMQVGNFTILERISGGESHYILECYYRCKCTCGSIELVSQYKFDYSKHLRCSQCLYNDFCKDMKKGMQHNQWTATGNVRFGRRGLEWRTLFEVQCTCGSKEWYPKHKIMTHSDTAYIAVHCGKCSDIKKWWRNSEYNERTYGRP